MTGISGAHDQREAGRIELGMTENIEALAALYDLPVYYVRNFDRSCLLVRDPDAVFLPDDLTPHEAATVHENLRRRLLLRGPL